MPTVRVPCPAMICGWRIGLLGVFAQERAKPADPFAADDVVGVDPLGQVGNVGDVPADDDLAPREDARGPARTSS